LMKRFKNDSPANVSFARGTFNSHPYVLASMNVFLNEIQKDSYQQQYQQLDECWDSRVSELNKRFKQADVPVEIAHLSSIWTVLYTQPSRYNWMYQYYLKAEGISLSWVGSGRIIMSFNFTKDDFEQVMNCFIEAAKKMQRDGWWSRQPLLTNKAIKREILKDMLTTKYPKLSALVYRKNTSLTEGNYD